VEDETESMEWLRKPQETDTAYQSFMVYLHLDPPRSLEKAAEETGKAIQTIKAHSSKYGWIARAKLYDKYIQQQVSETMAETMADELISVQEQIQAAAISDGGRLRQLWNAVLDDVETELESDGKLDPLAARRIGLALNTLATARKTIDDMIRKAARMPSGYKSEVTEEDDSDGEYIIQADGPPILVSGEDDE
jgi:hypothetical protein